MHFHDGYQERAGFHFLELSIQTTAKMGKVFYGGRQDWKTNMIGWVNLIWNPPTNMDELVELSSISRGYIVQGLCSEWPLSPTPSLNYLGRMWSPAILLISPQYTSSFPKLQLLSRHQAFMGEGMEMSWHIRFRSANSITAPKEKKKRREQIKGWGVWREDVAATYVRCTPSCRCRSRYPLGSDWSGNSFLYWYLRRSQKHKC